MEAIYVEGLTKKFGRTYAVRDATFYVKRGSVTALLGPNGAGKTTTIKVLLGLLRPNSGRVRVLGMDPWTEGVEVRRSVGVLHERPVYPRGFRVRDLLRYVAKLRDLGTESVDRALSLTGLKEYGNTKVSALSRGYLQRLGLAVAIMGDPEVLLLDEPTANLDPAARMEILDLISLLSKELDVTVLVSSHIIPELERICDHAILISRGRVVEQGSLQELAERHGGAVVLEVKVGEPRGLASELISMEGVIGVEIVDGGLLVKLGSHRMKDIEEELVSRGLPVRFRTSSLQDIYTKVVVNAQVSS